MAAGGRRKGGAMIIIILAILLIGGLGAVFFLFRNQFSPSTTSETPTQAPEQTMVNIVITTQFVARGTELTDAVLTSVPYPEKDLVQGTFYTDTADVVGKSAKYDLEARMPLTSSLIADKKVGSYAAFQIPKGMVAVSIPISRLTAVSYAPVEGDHVNIIVSLMLTDVDPNFQTRLPNNVTTVIQPGPRGENLPPSITVEMQGGALSDPKVTAQGRVELDGNLNQPVYVVPGEIQRPRPVSQTLIQDAIVLHVGSFMDPTTSTNTNGQQTAAPADPNAAPTPIPTIPPVDENGQSTAAAQPKMPEDITLVVSPQDAVTLNYLMLIGGKLNLALRSAGDGEKVKTEAVTLQFLMDQYNIPNPAKLPFAVEPRVDELVMPTLIPWPTQAPQQ